GSTVGTCVSRCSGASAQASGVSNLPRPTVGAIREWRSFVLKPSHLPAWLRGHLGPHPTLRSCRLQNLHDGAGWFYACGVVGTEQLPDQQEFAQLTRTSPPCGYTSGMTTQTSHPGYVYHFRFCG